MVNSTRVSLQILLIIVHGAIVGCCTVVPAQDRGSSFQEEYRRRVRAFGVPSDCGVQTEEDLQACLAYFRQNDVAGEPILMKCVAAPPQPQPAEWANMLGVEKGEWDEMFYGSCVLGTDRARQLIEKWEPLENERVLRSFGSYYDAVRLFRGACRVLAALGQPEAIPVLRNALNHSDPMVFTEAATALGRLHDDDSATQIMSLVDRERVLGIAETLLDALGELGDAECTDCVHRAACRFPTNEHFQEVATRVSKKLQQRPHKGNK